MAVNKVEINGKTIIDLTKDTVLPQTLLSGVTAHNAAGEPIVGAVAVAPASATLPKAPGEAAVGEENTFARGDHVHPKEVSDADRAAWNGKTSLVISEIPKGRMRGDIKGTGEVGTAQDLMSSQYYNTQTDPVNPDSWACDIDGDGSINYSDYQELAKGTLYSTPLIADFYNKWTYHKVDDLTGYWTTDLAISGVTAEMNVSISVQGNVRENTFIKAEPLAGGVRIHANYPPIRALPCSVTYGEGTGQGSICAAEGVSDAQLEERAKKLEVKLDYVTLLASKWSQAKQQVVVVPDYIQDSSGNTPAVFTTFFEDKAEETKYKNAGVSFERLKSFKKLRFYCETTPTEDIYLGVILVPVTANPETAGE